MKKFLNGLTSFSLLNSKMNSNGLLDQSLLASKTNSTVYGVSGGQDSILSVIILIHFFSFSIFQRNFDNFGCDSLPKFLNDWNTFVGYRNSTFLVEDHISSVGPPNSAEFGGTELEKSFTIKNKQRKKRAKNNDNLLDIVYCQHFWQSKNFFCSEVLFELSWLGELSYTLILAQTSVQSENKARVWRKKNLIRFSQLQKIFSVGLGNTKSDFIEKSINNLLRGTSPKSFSESSDLGFHYSTNSFFTSSIVKPQIRFSIGSLFAGNTAQDFLFCTHAPNNFQFLKKHDFLKHGSSTLSVFETKKQQTTLTISKSLTEFLLFAFFETKKGTENFEKNLEKGSKKAKQRKNTRKNRLRLASYGAGLKFCKNFGNRLKKGKEFLSKNQIFELPRKKTFEKSSKNLLKTKRLIKQLYSKPTKLNFFISHNCCCFPLKITTKLTLLRVVKTENCRKREFISFLVSRKKKSNNFVVIESLSLSFCLTQKIVQKTRTQQTPTNSLTRLQVSKFVKFYDLPVLHDITNFSTTFSRNKLRHVFIPFTRLIFAPQFENVYSNFSYLVGQDHEQIQIEIFKFKKIFKFSRSNRRIGLLISQECHISQFLKQSVIQTFISEYKELEISFRDLNKVINFLAHI